MKPDQAIVFLSGARRLVEKARDVPELKELADKAAAVAVYAKRAGESLELVNEAQEIRIRAERRAGDLLKAMEKNKGTRLGGNKSLPPDSKAKLSDVGVTKSQSSRWQAQASVPEKEFEKWAGETRAKGQELSANALRKVAKERTRKERITEIKARSRKEPAEGLLSSLEDGAKQFRCVYLDPPWDYEDETSSGAAKGHYPTMSPEKLAALPVGALAHKEGAHFWIWTTWPKIRDKIPHEVISAWGLEWVGEIVWNKMKIGTGRWLRSQTEVLILAAKGKSPLLRADQGNYFEIERTAKHSQKPEEFRKLIETLSPGPRVELFAREAADGWMRWGLEA